MGLNSDSVGKVWRCTLDHTYFMASYSRIRVHKLAFFFFFPNLFIYLFLAALGLSCCARAFSSCGKWGLLFVAVRRLLIKVASLVVEQGSRLVGFSCGMWAQ